MYAPTWNNEFVLPDGSYSISGIQDPRIWIYYQKTWDYSK